eukprot:TRINITY_DN894_c0_g2_i1.p1 TRINITY_DN894_c0_g2~~TRINITY_DN894_c0_g2_i1.p1  ORF type:complete len:660 (+),score=170.71 TRINITY_DN894_c0_g2_i1:87-2066(+)
MGCGASGAGGAKGNPTRRAKTQQRQAALDNSRSLHQFRAHAGQARSVRFASGGACVVSCGDDGSACMWEAATGRRIWKASVCTGAAALCCAAQREGQGGLVAGGCVAVGSEGGAVVLVGGSTGADCDWLCDPGAPAAHSCDFASDGATLFSAHDDGLIRVWDVSAATCLLRMKPRLEDGASRFADQLAVRCGEASAVCASGCGDGVVRVWDARAPHGAQQVRAMRGHRGPVLCVAVAPEHQGLHAVASAGADGVVREWDTGSAKTLQRLRGPWKGAAAATAYTHGGTGLLVGTAGSGPWLWRHAARGGDGEEDTVTALCPPGDRGGVLAVDTALGTTGADADAATAGEDGRVALWLLSADAATAAAAVAKARENAAPEQPDPAPNPETPPGARTTCVVCLDARRCMIFDPCRHMVCCAVCAEQVAECPLCRVAVTDRTQAERNDSNGSVCTYMPPKPALADRELCVVCLDERRAVVFLPCLHMVCCEQCGEQVAECPLCRVAVEERRLRNDSKMSVHTFVGRPSALVAPNTARKKKKKQQQQQEQQPADPDEPAGRGYTLNWSLRAAGAAAGTRQQQQQGDAGGQPLPPVERSPRPAAPLGQRAPRSPVTPGAAYRTEAPTGATGSPHAPRSPVAPRSPALGGMAPVAPRGGFWAAEPE